MTNIEKEKKKPGPKKASGKKTGSSPKIVTSSKPIEKSITTKQPEPKKIEKKKIYDDSWMYILLLTTLVILMESLKTYTFSVGETILTYSLILLPFVYFIANYITKKYGYEKTIVAISISGVSIVLFVGIMDFALGKSLTLSGVSGQFCGYVISQLINLTIYKFMLENTRSPFLLVFLNYIFSLAIFYMFYTLIYLNMIILEEFWIGYFIALIIQGITCFCLTTIDALIAKGKEC